MSELLGARLESRPQLAQRRHCSADLPRGKQSLTRSQMELAVAVVIERRFPDHAVMRTTGRSAQGRPSWPSSRSARSAHSWTCATGAMRSPCFVRCSRLRATTYGCVGVTTCGIGRRWSCWMFIWWLARLPGSDWELLVEHGVASRPRSDVPVRAGPPSAYGPSACRAVQLAGRVFRLTGCHRSCPLRTSIDHE